MDTTNPKRSSPARNPRNNHRISRYPKTAWGGPVDRQDVTPARAEFEMVASEDGKSGLAGNEMLMQFQADVLGVPVVRPKIMEVTALGAACAAGLAVGFWDSLADLLANWREDRTWQPCMDAKTRDAMDRGWLKAVKSSLG